MKKDDFFIIPKSTDTERIVIGEILQDPKLIKEYNIQPEYFTSKYRPICETILKAWQEKGAADLIILSDYLDSELIDRANMATSEAFTTANFPAHAGILKDYAEKRKLHSILISSISGINNQPINDVVIPFKQFLEERRSDNLEAKIRKFILSADTLAASEYPVRRKILDPWLMESSISMIAGWRGVGKSAFVLAIMEAITRGENFGPWQTITPSSCLWLDGEMVIQDVQKRIKSESSSKGKREKPFLVYSDHWGNMAGIPKANILNETFRTAIFAICQDWGVKVIVLDNIGSLAPGADENDKSVWDPINQWLLQMRFAGISSIFIHHLNKKMEQRETSSREDNLDISITLTSPKESRPEDGLRMIAEFTKKRIPISEYPKIEETEFQALNYGDRIEWTHKPAEVDLREKVKALSEEGLTTKEIAEVANKSIRTIQRIIKDLDK